MVWYNFMYHVDREFEISPTLSAWATDVSQPYLQRHAPQFLAINTIASTYTLFNFDTVKYSRESSTGSDKFQVRGRFNYPHPLGGCFC